MEIANNGQDVIMNGTKNKQYMSKQMAKSTSNSVREMKNTSIAKPTDAVAAFGTESDYHVHPKKVLWGEQTPST